MFHDRGETPMSPATPNGSSQSLGSGQASGKRPSAATAGSGRLISRRAALALMGAFFAGCASSDKLEFLGYQIGSIHSRTIRTVRVPVFQNKTYRTGLEDDLTRAVIREIENRTPYKVVAAGQDADTELVGTIVSNGKNVINRNPLNEVREAETTLAVEIFWRDLRSGELLSQPRKKKAPLPAALDPTPEAPYIEKPLLVTTTANFVPELGQSMTSAQVKACDKLADQIVGMMENPW